MSLHQDVEVLVPLNSLRQLGDEVPPLGVHNGTPAREQQLVLHAHMDPAVPLHNGQPLALEARERGADSILEVPHGLVLRIQFSAQLGQFRFAVDQRGLLLVHALAERLQRVLAVHQVEPQGLKVGQQFSVLASMACEELVVLLQEFVVQRVDLVVLHGPLPQRSAEHGGVVLQPPQPA